MLSRRTSATILAGVAGCCLSTTAMGVLVYTQDFNTLPSVGPATWANNTTLANWSAYGSGIAGVATARDGGTVNPIMNVDTGTSTAGGIHSYGATGSLERALGSIGSGGVTAGDITFCVVLQNTTTDDLYDFTLSYDGEQWRQAGNTTTGTTNKLVFDWRTFATVPVAADLRADNTTGYTQPGGTFDFTGPLGSIATGVAIDGNTTGLVGGRGGYVPILIWHPGEYLVLRWWDDNDAGNDHGLGIDNLSLTATTSPAPGAMALLGLGGLIAARRRRS